MAKDKYIGFIELIIFYNIIRTRMDVPPGDEISAGILFQYINSVVTVLSGFLFYIYIIHFYNSEILGTVSLLLALVSLMNTIFTLGLGTGMQHFISYHMGRNEGNLVKNMIKKFEIISLSLAFLAFLFILLTSAYFAQIFFHTYKYLTLIRLSGIDLFFILMSGIFGSILIGLQKFKIQAIWNILGLIIAYSSPVIFLIMLHHLYWIVIGWSLGYMVSSLGMVVNIESSRKKIQYIKEENFDIILLMTYSLPVFISSLIGYGATYVDRFIVSYLMNLSELGIYNFSLLMVSAISFLVGPINSILLPKLSYMYGQKDMEKIRFSISKGIELLVSIYLPLALISAALAPFILLLIANKSYLPGSVPILIILVVSSIFVSGNILSVGMQAIKKTKIFLLTSSAALLSNLVLSFILIPRYGIIGAAVGFSSISIVSFILLIIYSSRYGILSIEWIKDIKIYISGFLTFFLIYLAMQRIRYSPLHLFLLILTGFIIYVLSLRFLRTFNRDDLEFIFSILPHFLAKLKPLALRILVWH